MFHFNPNSKTALFLSKSITKVLFFMSCMFGLNKQKGYCMQHSGIFGCLFAACSTCSLYGNMVLLAQKSPACFVLLLVKRWNPRTVGGPSNSCFLWNRVAFSASLGAHKVRLSSVSPGVLELSRHLSRIDCGVKNSPAVVGVTTVPVMDRMSYFYSCKNCARRWILKGWVKVISNLEKHEHCKKETV